MSRLALAAALALGAPAAFAQSQSPTQEQLLQRVELLARELERVKAELQQLRQAQQAAQPVAPAAAPQAAAVPVAQPPAAPAEPATVISSYGEINYNRPKDHSQAQADIRRFVIGLQHRFDEQTKMVSELEVEHSIASASDKGEVEVEQLYLEHRLNDTYGLRAGLFLMPVGLLNTNHEPTAYYGVERNFVETAIIPSTWREGGLQVFGEHDNGISWSAGITTGFDLTKWDASSSEGRESPLASIHQEMQLAKANNLAYFGSVDWRGIPGLRLGASVFDGKAAHGTAGFASPGAKVGLWDLHAKWTPGAWDLSALYARGSIKGAGDFNLTLAGAATPVPNAFDGWYAQAAYRWQLAGDRVLAPFVRYERYNTGRGFDGLPVGLNPGSYGTEGVSTVGLNFQLNPNVVFKADLQRFRLDTGRNRLDLGVGYAF
ncbi:hypothetical protein EXH51_07415 [Pelomonas saccharophila]|nr:hypothetical protein [Roseateles saccharophilus]